MDRPYFAKQLNGPIIKGLFNCIYDFLHKETKLTGHTDYFKGLSIATASEMQLRTIGQLMGVQRLNIAGIEQGTKDTVTFTADYVQQESYNDNIGFAEEYIDKLENPIYPAGMFAKSQYGSGITALLPIGIFRKLLYMLSVSDNICNLQFLTELIYIIFNSTDFTVIQESPDTFHIQHGESLPLTQVSYLRVILNNIYADSLRFILD